MSTEIYKYYSQFDEFDFSIFENYNVKILSETEGTASYYDTFDGALEEKGLFLEYFNGKYFLKNIETEKIILECEDKLYEYFFPEKLKCDELKQKLKSITDPKIIIKRQTYSKKEQKILFEGTGKHPDYEAIRYSFYDSADNELIGDFLIFYDDICCLQCSLEKNYISKKNSFEFIKYEQDSYFFCYSEFKNLICYPYTYAELLNIYLDFLPDFATFIKKDIDTEFLHKLRVNTRQMRSFLDYLKIFFPKKIVKKTDKTLRSLLKRTNIMRDLDVLILKKDYILKKLKINDEKTRSELFDKITELRKQEFDKLKEYFESPQFENYIEKLKKFEQKFEQIEITSTEILKIIERKHKKLLNLQEEIKKENYALLHKIRIKVKYLRYNINLFLDSDSPQLDKTLKALKKYQDYLGEITDWYAWQSKILEKFTQIDEKNVQNTVNAEDWLKIHLETLSEVEKLLEEWKSNENSY